MLSRRAGFCVLSLSLCGMVAQASTCAAGPAPGSFRAAQELDLKVDLDDLSGKLGDDRRRWYQGTESENPSLSYRPDADDEYTGLRFRPLRRRR